jgi:hypothetical protein
MNPRWTPGDWILGEGEIDQDERGYDGYIYAPPEEDMPASEAGGNYPDDLPEVAKVDHEPDARLIVHAKSMAALLEDCLALLSNRFGAADDPEAEELCHRVAVLLHNAGAGEPARIAGQKTARKVAGKCEHPGCTNAATDTVYSRNLRRVLCCCGGHAQLVVDERNPEYDHDCENCGCHLPIN